MGLFALDEGIGVNNDLALAREQIPFLISRLVVDFKSLLNGSGHSSWEMCVWDEVSTTRSGV